MTDDAIKKQKDDLPGQIDAAYQSVADELQIPVEGIRQWAAEDGDWGDYLRAKLSGTKVLNPKDIGEVLEPVTHYCAAEMARRNGILDVGLVWAILRQKPEIMKEFTLRIRDCLQDLLMAGATSKIFATSCPGGGSKL